MSRHRGPLHEHAKLLYALLDAADDDRLLEERHRVRWRKARQDFDQHEPHAEVTFYALLDELYRSGALDHSWIRARWLQVRMRIERDAPAPHQRET